jgi:hypothetical protein
MFVAFRTNVRKRKLRDDAHRGRYSEAEVEARLADAGRVLLALPWANCFPFGLQTLWSEAESDASERRPIPTSDQIRAMDQAYRWTALIDRPEERRLVLMRSLVLPASASGRPRYVWSWRRLQKATGFHRDTLKNKWGRGIRHILHALNRPTPTGRPQDWPRRAAAAACAKSPASPPAGGANSSRPWSPARSRLNPLRSNIGDRPDQGGFPLSKSFGTP